MDEAELCQGPGQGPWCGSGGSPIQIRFLGLAWKQRSEEGTLRLIPPAPTLEAAVLCYHCGPFEEGCS